jgi:hypothetical protein
LHDAIKDNERVLEHLKAKKSDKDKVGVLLNFLTQCGNLNASIPKRELGQMLFEHLELSLRATLDADRKTLEAL